MIAFFALGALFVGFSLWALYLTDIPQEQFLEDPRFEEEYVKYYQWTVLFGSGLIGIGMLLHEVKALKKASDLMPQLN